jgi:Asp-tRNA(Asn)/Glu-tRNA(Gln) amidotransferase A subunit family amidase
LVDNPKVPGLDQAERADSAVRSAEGLAEVRSIVAGREDDLSPMIAGLSKGPLPASISEVALAAMERDAVRARFLSFFESHDLLLLPVACLPAFPAGQEEFIVASTPIPYWQVLAPSRAASLFGVPAAVVPCGLTSDGLPVGVQIVGPPYSEDLVLTAAAALEQRLGRTPSTPPSTTLS